MISNVLSHTGRKGGFTFVEVILVVTIFSIAIVAVSDLFMRAQRTQRVTAVLQRLQDDGRFVLQRLTNEIRSGSIDFDCYGPQAPCGEILNSVNGNATLGIKNASGTTYIIRAARGVGSTECIDSQSTPCLLISDDRGITWTSLTSRGVKLARRNIDANTQIPLVSFFLSPDKDPFIFDEAQNQYLSNKQPTVTVAFTLASAVEGRREDVRLSLQTTIATREYKR